MDTKSKSASPPPSPSAASASAGPFAPRGTPATIEASPGDGAFSPPNADAVGDKREPNGDGKNAGQNCDDAFGPPPAFPSTSKSLGKRKRTLMAVSANGGGGSPLEGLSSEDEEEGSGGASAVVGGGKKHQSQVIHRIKAEAGSPPAGGEDAEKYNDAMLLASLSDVDSPKKLEEATSEANQGSNNAAAKEETARQAEARSPPRSSNASTASTPQRSNVNPNPSQAQGGGVVRPFPLQPKRQAVKREKYNQNNNLTVPMVPPPQSPDGRDPKAVNVKKEGAREGYAPPPPQLAPRPPPQSLPPSGASYPTHPGYHPRYPYPPHHQAGQAPFGPAGGHPAYPPGYPYHASYPPHHPQGPPAMHPSPYHPRAYYPGQHSRGQVHPPTHIPSSHASQGGPNPERWGNYLSPKQKTKPVTSGPEPVPVRSGGAPPPYGPPSPSRSHVVPSEDGDGAHSEGVYGRGAGPPPGPPPYGAGPPGPGMAYPGDARYAPPPPPNSRDGYYPGPPPGDYAAISRDDGSPPRSSQVLHPAEYPPVAKADYSPASANANANTPPRGQYDYYPEPPQAGGPPGLGYGTPPHSQGYHPDTPPGSSAYPHPGHPHPGHPHPGHPHYGRGPPPAHDPYEPFDYAASSPNEAHYHVPATVSNETESSPHGHGGPHTGMPPVGPPPAGGTKYHQFRKGGRTIHSEPIILRKKFSWRNYPELEEYLIANRTDYLRHSALNYTAEQKHFNNRLTEGLLELAAKLNYVFDETCFNFVAVRDRIRCYYKSYVQSSKKRGVVVGFTKQNAKKDAEHREQRDAVVGQA